MVAKRRKAGARTKKRIKDLAPKNLGAQHAKSVQGGSKHIAGVKYEDISVNCGTGMSKIV